MASPRDHGAGFGAAHVAAGAARAAVHRRVLPRRDRRPHAAQSQTNTGSERADRDARSSPALQGFLTSLSNPKSLLYWSAFLPPFLDPARSLTTQLITLGGLGILLEVCVLFGYTFVATTTRHYVASATRKRLLDAIAGIVFVGLGVYLVALSIIT